MKRRHKWLLFGGLGLIILGIALVVTFAGMNRLWQNRSAALTQTILEALPERSVGVTEELSHMDMPALQLQGEDFIGLLEIPAYGTVLPLCATWQAGKANRYPCRFDGTVYNGSLIISGSASQLACLKTIGHGDTVTITDLQGAVYTYHVTNIRRTDNARSETLRKEDAQLVLFIRDPFNLEYIIVSCN